MIKLPVYGMHQRASYLHTLKGHNGSVNSAQFSPTGNHIITTGANHKTIIWDAHTGKQLYTRLQLKGGDWLAYDEHYRFDGSQGVSINCIWYAD